MSDPTYDQKEINANRVWKRAFQLSEQENDFAPLGWSKWIPRAARELNASRDEAYGKTKPVFPTPGTRTSE
jgi:hypothetical protein